MTHRRIVELLAIATLLLQACRETPYMQHSPYPQSSLVDSVTWDEASIVTAAKGSDLWPVTWAADDQVYTAWGDGGGFGGDNRRGRVSMGFARLAGSPPALQAINVNGGVNSEAEANWDCRDCGKTAGIISIDGRLYAWVNEQEGDIVADLRLWWSDDRGAHWQRASWHFPDPLDPTFFPATFLNYGRDYAGATDDYVYIYGARWIWTQGGESDIYLMRAPKQRLTERSGYEFFAGLAQDGQAEWSDDIRARAPVFSDPNGVNNTGLTNVIYNAPLKRYILTSSHRPPQESVRTALGRLGIFDSPTPWGPWTTIAYHERWLGIDDQVDALNYDISTKWLSEDGRTFWMTFSGTGEYDRFNLIKGRLRLTR